MSAEGESREESALADALAAWLELDRRGAAPPVEEFAARHREIESELLGCLRMLAAIRSPEPELCRAPALSQVLGDYRLVRVVGRGGMGVVYEAEQQSLPRKVALKVLAPGAAADAERLARFRREIEATARLRHPNIVPIYEAGEAAGIPYYSMPLLAGRSLDHVLAEFRRERSRGPLASRRELVTWVARMIDVARALEAAHRAGILHRDIKPSNLFLEEDGRLLLLDFGLTRTSATAATLTGAPVGTPRYMSPEQILGGRRAVDGRTDLFSLAATFYELLALEPAFPGDDRESVFRAILSEDPPPLRRRDARVPRDLEVVLGKALEKEPERRYAALADFADDLQRFLDYGPVRARPAGPLGRLRRRARRNPVAAGAIAVAVVIGIGAALAPIVEARERSLAIGRLEKRARAHLAAGEPDSARDLGVQLAALVPDDMEARALLQAAEDALRERTDAARRAEAEARAREEIERSQAARVELRALHERAATLERELLAAEEDVLAWAPLAAKEPVLARRRDLKRAREEREALFREALSHLYSAMQLVPDLESGATPVRAEIAELAFEELRAAEKRRDRVRAQDLRALVETYDDRGLLAEEKAAGTLWLKSEPPGAEVRLYRYEDLDLLRVPVPCSASGESEEGALRAIDPRAPKAFLRLSGVAPASAPLHGGDELLNVCGLPPQSAVAVAGHLATPHPDTPELRHFVDLRREGRFGSVYFEPASELALEGERIELGAFPLASGAEHRHGTTPLELDGLWMGSYLALLSLEGFPDTRVPFEIARGEDEVLEIPLWTAEQVGAGFVYVPPGPAVLGGDPGALASFPLEEPDVPGYAMQRFELTFGEYFEFLRALEQRDPVEAQARGPRQGPAHTQSWEPLWEVDSAGRIAPELPRGMDLSWPAIGISYRDAEAYCRWRNEGSESDGFVYDLPTEIEWEKAARGADGRLFAWGDEFDWTFARLGLSSAIGGLAPGGLYPTDESVYGIRDLNGNVREWCSGPESRTRRVLRGGAWGNLVAADCHLANRAHERDPDFVDSSTGFRLVRRPR